MWTACSYVIMLAIGAFILIAPTVHVPPLEVGLGAALDASVLIYAIVLKDRAEKRLRR